MCIPDYSVSVLKDWGRSVTVLINVTGSHPSKENVFNEVFDGMIALCICIKMF
jgi:hypothetical protein